MVEGAHKIWKRPNTPFYIIIAALFELCAATTISHF